MRSDKLIRITDINFNDLKWYIELIWDYDFELRNIEYIEDEPDNCSTSLKGEGDNTSSNEECFTSSIDKWLKFKEKEIIVREWDVEYWIELPFPNRVIFTFDDIWFDLDQVWEDWTAEMIKRFIEEELIWSLVALTWKYIKSCEIYFVDTVWDSSWDDWIIYEKIED